MKMKPVAMYPHMVDQWDFEKNRLRGLDINLTPGGAKEPADWKCKKCGHEWVALIATRKESKGYCPKCEKDKQGPKTKTTISMVPHLIDYFDFDANPDIDPYSLTATKNKEANWKCSLCGHKWSATIHSRYYDKTGCPVCSGRVIKTGVNDVLSIIPEIEYYYDADYPNNSDLSVLGVSSKTSVHWKCPDCGYAWEQAVVDRIRRNEDGSYKVCGCSRCLKSTGDINYLEKYPDAAAMYLKSNPIPFQNLKASDRTTVYKWKCNECDYVFESTLGSMLIIIKKPHKGCPMCLGKVVAKPGESFADVHPELMDQYDPANEDDPYMVLPNSKKSALWSCRECGCTWMATFAQRHAGWGFCPSCNNTRAIKGYNTVDDLFCDIAKLWAPSNKIKADELMPSSMEWVNLVCPDCGNEHSVQVCQATAGNIKCPYCNEKKVAPGSNSLDITNPELIPMWSKQNTRDIKTVAAFMTKTAYWDCLDCGGTYPAEINRVVSGDAYCKYCADEALLPGFNSLDKTHPELAPEWSPRNRFPMSHVKAYSWYRAYWICPTCKGEHLATVKDHMEGNDSCKYCEKIVPLPGYNTLYATHRELVDNEWLFLNNCAICDPDEILETNSTVVWWQCRNDSRHKYKMSPNVRLIFKERGLEPCIICRGFRRSKSHFYRKKKK